MQRETMEFDVVIVGAGGPAGLSASCRLMQIGQESGKTLEVCVLEKGARWDRISSPAPCSTPGL